MEIGDQVPPVLEAGHIWRYNGNIFCFTSCDKCNLGGGCTHHEEKVKIGSGLNIRRAFIARPGYKIVAIDYKGIELRIAAQLSQEPVWKEAFRTGKDLHSEMAKIAFKTENPTKEERGQAKCANFGNLYLGSSYTLAQQSDLSEAEAGFIWSAWWDTVKTYKIWTDRQFMLAKTEEFVKTFFGRIRPLSGMIAKAQSLEAAGKRKLADSQWKFIHRTAVNSPVQGTAADLMKIAMVLVVKWIEKEKLQDRVKLLLTVHDELVFEIKDDHDFEATVFEASRKMCPDLTSYNWEIPLGTDIEVGDNWAELYELDQPKAVGEGIATPVEKEVSDKITVVVNSKLNQMNSNQLHLALVLASNGSGVRIPVKLRIQGKTYRSGNITKVNEAILREELKKVPGTFIEEAS